jgi:pimeloyl-ACP methyl ester carboxylesterase
MKIKMNDGVALFVDIDGASLTPEGPRMRQRPTVILLHGGPGMDHTSLKLELASLTDIAQLVYIDHRANGRSESGPQQTWNLAQWGDDIRTVCDILGVTAPIVMGQSFGGMVAQSYATRHPDHPAALILSSTAATATLSRNLAVFERLGGVRAREVAARFYEDANPETLPEFLSECMPLYNTRFSDPDGMKRGILRIDVLFHFFANEYLEFDFRSDLKKISCPTLVLGGEDDPTTPIEDQEDIAASLHPELVEFHRFADCGHGAYRDCPDTAIPIIRDFIVRNGGAEEPRAALDRRR